MKSNLKIGWSEVDITPNQKISLAGQFFERVTDEVESPITVTAFAVENDDDVMIICSCDLASVGLGLVKAVRENVKDKLPFSVDKIIINAIHTHTSFEYSKRCDQGSITGSAISILEEFFPEDIKYAPLVSSNECMSFDDAFDFLVEKVTEAILSAWENRDYAYYSNAFGRVCVGMNRRVCYDDGSAKMWGDTNLANFESLESGNDSGMELIYTFDKEKKLTGVVANIACPAQVVEHRSFISSDYWGKVKENLRAKFGNDFKVLSLCSAAGDLAPRDLIRWVEPETYIDDPNIKHENVIEHRADPSMFDVSGLKLVGKRISNEIIFVYEETNHELKNDGLLKHKSLILDIPIRKVTISDYNDAINKINDFISKNRNSTITHNDVAMLHIYAGTLSRYRVQQRIETIPIEVNIVRFGDVAFASFPFELFLDYGNKIRARSKAKQTFLIQLASGNYSYLPTQKAEKGSHYSAYVSSGVAGHEGGDMLVRTILREINEMF